MRRLLFILGLILTFVTTANAQVDALPIVVGDTTRLNESFGMIGEYPRPPIYDIWFKRIADCEGFTLPPQEEIDKLHYLVVNSENFSDDTSKTKKYIDKPKYDGMISERQHVIILRLASTFDYAVVAHEFLHYLLWFNYGDRYLPRNKSHPSKYFGRCGIRSE